MSAPDDLNARRLIEDLIPVETINTESRRQSGHIARHPRKLHLWWARRPLAAARAAVYATLVMADTEPDARSSAFFEALCGWDASDRVIREARQRILDANGGTPPRVLDLFAGGGAIPLEAARLGCLATAVELNPVAHVIERCTLDYPQRFGADLAEDVRTYGRAWIERTWQRVGHLYPSVPLTPQDEQLFEDSVGEGEATGRPIAYLWTRTVPCPNSAGGEHALPLVRQTWLAKKRGRYAALQPIVDRARRTLGWKVAVADDPSGFDVDPSGFSSRGRASCLICGAAIDAQYVKDAGVSGRMGIMPLAAVVPRASARGRDFLAAGTYPEASVADCEQVLAGLDVDPPSERIPAEDTRNFWTPQYGLTRFRDLFTPRQLATLCAFAHEVHEAHRQMVAEGVEPRRAEAIAVYLGIALDRVVLRSSTLSIWDTGNLSVTNALSRQALSMSWDFAEANPFGAGAGQASEYVENVADIIEELARVGQHVEVHRTSATQLPNPDGEFDAVITDPPYYDNISYADLSDFFYVWLKRSIGFLFEEDFAGEVTPKKREAIVAPYRHGGDKAEAQAFYEQEMSAAFQEAHRVLKPGAPLVCVYAHKTTVGWASLVEALRRARFTITEAWPVDTELTTALKKNTASLASSIFLVARRRDADEVGSYHDVLRDLDQVINERITRLSAAGVSGSDLVVAAIGAGLAPFTRYSAVELPSGEPVDAERFLDEVQARVLNAVLAKLHELGDGVGAIDPATRYYVLARTMFGWTDIEFDEANNLARTAGVELSNGLASGALRLADVTGKVVHLRDFEDRGREEELGEDGAHLIDALHGLLWRARHATHEIPAYLDRVQPDPGRLRLVAQALQGRALRDESETKSAEAQACERLLGAWGRLVEDNLMRRRQ